MRCRLLAFLFFSSLLVACKKDDPIVDIPIPSDLLPEINAATHRLIGIDHGENGGSTYKTTSYFHYDTEGRCTTYGTRSREVVLGYWDDSEVTLTWENGNIEQAYETFSSDIGSSERTRSFSYSTQGDVRVRLEYAEDESLINRTEWVEGDPTIHRSVDYHYDWQIGLYDSTITFYEKDGNNAYSRYAVRQGDTNLIRIERFDAKGRLISFTIGETTSYKHYYDELKNPYPTVRTLTNNPFDAYNTGIDAYGVITSSNQEAPPEVFSNGDLPQFSVDAFGDTLVFQYEAL